VCMYDCSGDDITNICRDAAVNGMRRLMAQGRTPADVLKMREMGQVHVSSFKECSICI